MKKKLKILFAIYLCIVAYIVFFRGPFRPGLSVFGMKLFSEAHLQSVNLIPFRNIARVFSDIHNRLIRVDTGVMNIGVNLLLLFPFGVLYPAITKRSVKRTILTGLLFSVGIEIMQFFTMTGFTDIDDVLMNTAGAAIGALVWQKTARKNHPAICG